MIPLIIPVRKHEENKQQLLDLIDQSETSDVVEGDDRISRCDFHMPDGHPKIYFELFYETVREELVQAFNFLQYDANLVKWWFQQYNHNDQHGWHFHTQTVYSITYYLELPEGLGTQVQIPPSNAQFQAMVNEGDMLIIPSTWKHRSPPNHTNQRKTIIALDIG